MRRTNLFWHPHNLLVVVFLISLVSMSPMAVAQMRDDPFPDIPEGTFDEEEKDESKEEKEEPQEEEVPPTPLVIQLLEIAGRGNIQLAESTQRLTRLNRWKEVSQLIEIAGSRPMSDAETEEVARIIGPANLLKIQLNEKVTPAGREAAKRLADKAAKIRQAPERLKNAISQLSSNQTDVQLGASRQLLQGGNLSVVEIVSAIAAGQRDATRDELLRILMRLGSGGVDALQQVAIYGTPDARRHATAALARLGREKSMADVITALYAADASPEEQDSAKGILKQLGLETPSQNAVVRGLARHLEQLLKVARSTPNDSQMAEVWVVGSDRTSVNAEMTSVMMANYRAAVDVASRLRRIGYLPADVQTKVVLTDVGYQVLVDPDWGDAEQKDAVRKAYGQSVSGSALSWALASAIEKDDEPAMIGLIRLVDTDNVTPLAIEELLRSGDAKVTPLVEAATHSQPRVRFEAALVAAKLAGSTPYAGSSRVRRTLAELRTLDKLPTVVLVETSPEAILVQEQILGQMGYEVRIAGSVNQVQRLIRDGGDIRMIVSTTRLRDATAIEMLDLVRRTQRGHHVPIVFYGEDEVIGLDSERWAAPAIQIERPVSTFAFRDLVTQIDRMRRLPPLTSVDRQLYQQEAGHYLTKAGPLR